jgi:putative membrane protein
VLEIGTGSGYQTAVLASLRPLVRRVFSIERLRDLSERAEQRLHAMGSRSVRFRHADGYEGWPEEGPFDGILVTAAPPEVPQALLEQLAPGGRMVVPVGGDGVQELQVFDRTESRCDRRDPGVRALRAAAQGAPLRWRWLNRRPAGRPRRGVRPEWLALVLRGMAMGIAELVPGISGGTIAFITGIYDELLATLARLRVGSLRAALAAWAAGVLGRPQRRLSAGVLALGHGLWRWSASRACSAHLLDHVPVLVWAFFFGLIAASVVQIGRRRRLAVLLGFGLVGVLLGLALLTLGHRDGGAPLWLVFVGGMAAISAWLLPAVSGSFLLLVLGLYEPVLRAFNAGEWLVPLTLAFGCLVGLLAFSRLLHWLMRRVREPLLALLTGFMAGSLATLWPWRHDGALLTPEAYTAATGNPGLLGPALAAGAMGVLVLWLLSRLE